MPWKKNLRKFFTLHTHTHTAADDDSVQSTRRKKKKKNTAYAVRVNE